MAEDGHDAHAHVAAGALPAGLPERVSNPQSHDRLDILVAYTATAAENWADRGGALAAIRHAGDYLKMVFRNNDLPVEPHIVHIAQASADLDRAGESPGPARPMGELQPLEEMDVQGRGICCAFTTSTGPTSCTSSRASINSCSRALAAPPDNSGRGIRPVISSMAGAGPRTTLAAVRRLRRHLRARDRPRAGRPPRSRQPRGVRKRVSTSKGYCVSSSGRTLSATRTST